MGTVAEREEDLRRKPVGYHANGTVKQPVTYSQLLRECERLLAIVDKLPKTHDGITIAPGTPLWMRRQDGVVFPVESWAIYNDGSFSAEVQFSPGAMIGGYDAHETYSSPEAAEAEEKST